MHESLSSDSISLPDAKSQVYPEESKINDVPSNNSHPWHQLQTITTFEQLTVSAVECNSGMKTVCSDQFSRSGSNKSSCSISDESSDISFEDSPVKERLQKKCRNDKKHHSDPSHDRIPSRQGSCSSDSHHHLNRSNNSLKRKLSSSESGCQSRNHRQDSASMSGRVSEPYSNNTENYRLGVTGTKAVRGVNTTLTSSLMIESLIDQICKMMIRDPPSQKAMYRIICDKLYNMGIIDKTYAVDELQIARNHYQKALYQMFTMGRSVIQSSHKTEYLLPVTSVKIDLSGENFMEVSRYKDEFLELEFLAKGGFGKVYRVRHRLDGACYAVKKIYFRHNDQIIKSFQEVKMLANLNHPNVVSYKAAWIEPADNKDLESISSTSTRSTATGTDTNASSNCFEVELPSVQRGASPESDDIIFSESAGDGVELSAGDTVRVTAKPQLTIECVHEKVTERTTVAYNSGTSLRTSVASPAVSNAVQPYRSPLLSKEIRHKKRVTLAVLYVQMQLCELTLRDWLDGRNASTDFDTSSFIPDGLNLFQKIVRGVEYVHSKHIVHHDLKPSNVFLNNDLSLVQVGDFGLSCYVKNELKHGCNIGTPHYAAPEQLKGECDPKSDIYSLGIILVEILVPFQTAMERFAVIENLRKGKVPNQLEAATPAIAGLVRRLVDPNSNLRPTATELVKELQIYERLKCVGRCLEDQNKIINEINAQHQAEIVLRDKEIVLRDKEIVLKDKKIVLKDKEIELKNKEIELKDMEIELKDMEIFELKKRLRELEHQKKGHQ